jgi:hypothetical protein
MYLPAPSDLSAIAQSLLGYIIQTPFYGKSFWSLLLICKTDADMPETSCKTSGIIQTSSDIDLEFLLSEVQRKAAVFKHHPLILPVYMFMDHYSKTERLLKKMVKMVDDAEKKLMKEIKNQRSKNKFLAAGDHALIDISQDLHATSMDLAELNLRRSFETDVAEQLEKALPRDSQLLRRFNRFELGSKRNKSTIDGMGARIDSLKNLVRLSLP